MFSKIVFDHATSTPTIIPRDIYLILDTDGLGRAAGRRWRPSEDPEDSWLDRLDDGSETIDATVASDIESYPLRRSNSIATVLSCHRSEASLFAWLAGLCDEASFC